MLILRSSPTSPFGRKAAIAADVLGLGDQIEIVACNLSDPDDPIRRQNPLGKIPALILESGEALFDSAVIVEYLDHRAGGGRIIPTGEARFAVLTTQALADGLLDAAVLVAAEKRWREPAKHEPKWLAHQSGKIERALVSLEDRLSPVGAIPDVGQIAAACGLGYLDLRLEGQWRPNHPRLVDWLNGFADKVSVFAATHPA
jgi:glutathione S-transferase